MIVPDQNNDVRCGRFGLWAFACSGRWGVCTCRHSDVQVSLRAKKGVYC